MIRMPAEWETQKLTLLSFPHEDSDWANDLEASLSPFIRLAQAIAYSQSIYIICKDKEKISSMFCSKNNMTFIEIPTNDTWIRDYGYITVQENNTTKLLDFNFNGWGNKYKSNLDNNVNIELHKKGYMGITPLKTIDLTLEGGSIESDGHGTIMTTTSCLCNENRNNGLTKDQVTKKLQTHLGASRVLFLDYGYLNGDDTDGHVDTLARFINKGTIAYMKCTDSTDEHYEELSKMEEQLKSFTTLDGNPYKLIPLPMTKPIYKNNQRLASTYANFVITNNSIIYPTYEDEQDSVVDSIFKDIFPNKEIIPINSLKLIEEGGSLHCSTMQVII